MSPLRLRMIEDMTLAGLAELDFPHFCLPRLAGSPEDIV